MKQPLANTAKICAVVVLAIGSVGAHAPSVSTEKIRIVNLSKG